jgi:uncharacterized protein CbrC (UPF0167 family)
MSYMKRALDEILNCSICKVPGYLGWTNSLKLESCECNPYNLNIKDMEIIK